MNSSRLYIIIVTYNASKWLDKVLSYFIKLPEEWKVIVVDNASTDNTLKIIHKKYPFVEIIANNSNLGFGKANNIGLNLALKNNVDHVLLLNQDAWISVEDIKKLINIQRKNPDFYIVSPIHYNGKGDNLDDNFSTYILSAPDLLKDAVLQKYHKDIYAVTFCNAACWLLNRDCLKNIGGFSPSFYHYGEDDNYIDRVVALDKFIGIVPSAKVFHDRENRKNNPEFFNDLEIRYRKLLKKLSNPQESNSFKVYFALLKYVIKIFVALLKFDIKTIKLNYAIFLRLFSNAPEICVNLKNSRKHDANFIKDRCPVCAKELNVKFNPNAICDDLAKDWQLSDKDRYAFNLREGETCCHCKSSRRARIFSEALVSTVNLITDSNFIYLKDMVKSAKFKKLKIAEINSCANLHKYLKKSKNVFYSEYGSSDPAIPSQDITKLSYDNNFFDLVLNTDTLEHIPDYKKALEEQFRVLKTGGYYVFTAPVLFDRKTKQRCSLENGILKHTLPASYHGYYYRYSEDRIVFWEFGADFVQTLEEYFQKVDIFRPYGEPHPSLCCFICKKEK